MALLGCLFFCHVQDEFVSVKPENPHFVSLGGYGSWRRTLFPNHRQNEEVGATGLSFTSTSLCICLRRKGKRRKRLPALEGSREGNLCLISLGNPFCSFLVLLATLSKNPSIASLRKKKKRKKKRDWSRKCFFVMDVQSFWHSIFISPVCFTPSQVSINFSF